MRKRKLQARDKQGRHTSPIETPMGRVDMTLQGPRKGAMITPSTRRRGTQTTKEATRTITKIS